MIKTKKSSKEFEIKTPYAKDSCTHCHAEKTQFDSFIYHGKRYCGGCVTMMQQPIKREMAIAEWVEVGSNGQSY